MTAAVVSVNDQGRVVVPKALRDELALTSGTELLVFVEDGRLVLEERSHLLRRLQAVVRAGLPEGVDLVAELVADRRADAALETPTSTGRHPRPKR